ncbi:protein kinase [Streptomyces sp. NPDC004065]|uniref:protein kinase n=1 Tax=Streptomyces sp. NPDC004065 TaxID=3364689 RepID=UPI003850311B
MDDYAGRVLADRYRLPLPPSDEYELTESRAFDTYSGQEVLVRQVPLPEVVEAEVLDADGLPEGFTARDGSARRAPARTGPAGYGQTAYGRTGRPARGDRAAATRRPSDPAVRRALEAAQAAARIPDHPRLDQVFDVFAEGGSLWIVSELVAARPLAALLAEKPLTPYRAAEVASDLLMALRVLHAHGWVHRNLTPRTVLVCDDGRVMLTGLAVGAAEEALCGYDPVPAPDGTATGTATGTAIGAGEPGTGTGAGEPGAGRAPEGPGGGPAAGLYEGRGGPDNGRAGLGGVGSGPGGGLTGGSGLALGAGGPVGAGRAPEDPEAARRAAIEARAAGALPLPGTAPGAADPAGAPGTPGRPGAPAPRTPAAGEDIRAARAGAIAAYRAGARAAARVQEAQQGARAALPGARPPAEDGDPFEGTGERPYGVVAGREQRPGSRPPGQIADPYGVGTGPWNGTTADGAPRSAGGAAGNGTGNAGARPRALPAGGHGLTPAVGPAPTPPYDPAPGPGPFPGSAPGPASGSAPGPTPGSTPGSVSPARWDDLAAGAAPRRGPATALAAERARQARMTVVGPVTERWAPEQAGPVHDNWQLAAPIGPATDLWALGALLFRAVQGHAPYPEESTAELVQMVCAEPPAFAEECGPLRPVVESLLRQDPTERPDFEELSGWLRSLVRSAPEPEAGAHVVAAPPADPSRLPIVRRRGELVRRRRAGLPAPHGRHKRARRQTRSPRSLGRTLLLLVLLLLAAAVAYAVLFMPKSDARGGGPGGDRTRTAGEAGPAPAEPGGDSGRASGTPGSGDGTPGAGHGTPGSGDAPTAPGGTAGSAGTQSTGSGFALRTDSAGFQVAVAKGWTRTPPNDRRQVVYSHGDFELLVVVGRDGAGAFGGDPMVYQREKEAELQGYRDSSWATSSGLRTIQVGGRTMAEGQFTWTDASGRRLFVRNLAVLIGGRYHVVQVRGPEAQRDEVSRVFEQASATYRYTG